MCLPATVALGDSPVELRRATAEDVPALVAMLADEPLGAGREADGDPAPYRRAFDLVDGDPAHVLPEAAGLRLVARRDEARPPGCHLG